MTGNRFSRTVKKIQQVKGEPDNRAVTCKIPERELSLFVE